MKFASLSLSDFNLSNLLQYTCSVTAIDLWTKTLLVLVRHPQLAISALEKRVRWTDSYPPSIFPTPASVPFVHARQESRSGLKIAEAVQERILEAPSPSASTSCSPNCAHHPPRHQDTSHMFQTTPKNADNNKSTLCWATSPTTDTDVMALAAPIYPILRFHICSAGA
jgi:hypothetical protein